LPFFLLAQETATKLIIHENTSRSLRLSISIPPPNFTQQKINDQIYEEIRLDGFVTQPRPGAPAIPTLAYTLILPPEGNFQLSFTTTPGAIYYGKNLLPSLQTEVDWAVDSVRYHFGKIKKKFLDLPPVRLAEIGVWRGFRVGRLEIIPLQINGDEIQFFSEINLVVEFNVPESSRRVPASQPIGIEQIVLKSALNFAVARSWRLHSSVVPALKTSPATHNTTGAIKITIKDDGLYSVSYRLLDSLSLNPAALNPATLQLWNKGRQIPIRLVDDGDEQFEIGESIEFFGERLTGDTTYYHDHTNENIYWLTSGDSPGKRITKRPVATAIEPIPPTANYFWEWRHFEQDQTYYHGDNDTQIYSSSTSPGETWIWQKLIGGQSFLTALALPNPALSGTPSCSLRVRVRGTTIDPATPSHHLRFLMNDNVVGEIFFDDLEEVIFQATFPSQWLRESNNLLKLLLVNDTGARIDQIYLDWIEVGYWRQYVATENGLAFKEPQNANGTWARYRISNLNSDRVLLFDRRYFEMLEGFAVTQTAPGQFQIEFIDTAQVGRDYFVLTPPMRLTPARIWADSPSDWHASSNAADYILVTHTDFREAAERLAQHRRQHRGRPALVARFVPRDQRALGLQNGAMRVAVVEVEDIYDEFNFGIPDPEAIRSFLQHAYLNWQRPAPAFVCFFGDASLDPKMNAVSSVKRNFVFSFGNPASDNRLACFDGPQDFLPELFVGRIPVETPAQAHAVVDKIISYEQAGIDEWHKTFIFFNGGVNSFEQGLFRSQSEALIERNVVPPPISGQAVRIYKTTPGRFLGELRPEILSAIDAGACMLTYSGHAGSQTWELMLVNADIASLNNRDKYPFIASMTCLTAHFANSDQNSFGEEFFRAQGKGAIAFWGTSGYGFIFQDGILLDSLYTSLSRDTVRYAGVATTLARFGLWKALGNAPTNVNSIDQYTLLGDPALELALPTAPDLSITPANINFQPSSPTEDDLQVQVGVQVRNLGLATTDSVQVEITTVATENGHAQLLREVRMPPIGWADSLVAFWPSRGNRGDYRVRAEVDRLQEVAEVNEMNNIAERTAYFAPSALTLAAPMNFSLLNDSRPVLRVYNPSTAGTRTYFFEVDTTADFNTPAKIASPAVAEDRLRTGWQVPSPLPNHLYFWRSRIINNDIISSWQTASFWVDEQSAVSGFRQTGAQFQSGIFDKTTLQISANGGISGVTLVAGQKQGTFQSVEIGPAKVWQVCKWQVTSGNLQLAVLGRRSTSNVWQMLKDSLTASEISLIDIEAQQFPYLRLQAEFQDDDSLDAPVLTGWTVGFVAASDFATGLQVASASADSVLEGESVRLAAEIFNFAGSPAGSAENVQVAFSQFDPRAEKGKRLLATYGATLAPESSQSFTVDWNSTGSRGETAFFVEVDPGNQYVEPVEFNNTVTFSVFVRNDKTAPRLEVTFDGRSVISGDHVSSHPTILCNIFDDSLLPIADTNRVQVFLNEERVPYTDADEKLQFVSFTNGPLRAQITYRPQLEGGRHVIEFFVRDATNNPAYYRAEVQVDTEFHLRGVMNYPNPFRDETDFTYYLTQPAEEVTIKIFTLAGRLIATIENAPASAGFNRAHWNGRDADGDVLANGVYLYKLTAKLGERRLEEIQRCVVMR
jgi:hypothetical protein